MKKIKLFIAMLCILVCISFCSCSATHTSDVNEKIYRSAVSDKLYSSQYVALDNASLLEIDGLALLLETEEGENVYHFQDGTRKMIPDNAVCFYSQGDTTWYAKYEPGEEEVIIELPSGIQWRTGIKNYESENMKLIPGENAVLLQATSELYYVTSENTELVEEDIIWETVTVVNGRFFAIGCPREEQTWRDHFYEIDESGCYEIGVLELEGTVDYIAGSNEKIVFVTSTAIYEMTSDGIFQIARLVEHGIVPQKLLGIIVDKDEIYLFSNDGYFILQEGQALSLQEEKEPLQKTTIEVACLWENPSITSLIALYNQSQETVTANLTIYEDPVNLTVELLGGKVPDVICAYNNREFLRRLQNKGYLQSVTGMIDDTVTEEEYFTNIIDIGSVDGETYYFPLNYQLVMYKVPTILLKGKNRISTLEELDQILQQTGSDTYMLDHQRMIFNHLLMEDLSQWVDYKTHSCSFDSVAFGDLLQYCKRFVPEKEDVNWEAFNLIQYCVIHSAEMLRTAAELQNELTPYGPDVTFIPAPMSSYYGAAIMGEQFIAKTTTASEAADDLLTFLIQDQAQEFLRATFWALPIKRSAMDTFMDNGMNARAEPIYEEKLIDLIERADHYQAGAYFELTDIVIEEAEYYFAGLKSLEETQRLIQDRVTLYLQEQE